MTPSLTWERVLQQTFFGAGALVSAPIDCRDLQQLNFQHRWNGTLNGLLFFQLSNQPGTPDDPDGWVLYDPAPVYGTPTVVGVPGTRIVIARQLPRWVRWSYTNLLGDGTMTVYESGRRI